MIKYLLLVLLPFSLYASKILSYNIYERTDRTDVMITFDTPYSGEITQGLSNSKIIIKLQDASIESSKIKNLTSDFLQSLTITPLKEQVQIVADVGSAVKLVASKTSDAYGLRLRFTNNPTSKAKASNNQVAEANPLANLPTKKSNDMSTSYYIVVGILIIGIIILLILKNKMTSPKDMKRKDSWLFKPTSKTSMPLNSEKEINAARNEVSIRFQKSINEKNSVVMLDFANESYLVLMGNSNILLDKFKDNKPSNQEEFETILQSRHQELEDFLGSNQNQVKQNKHKEPLQAYKERAASLIYSDDYN